MTKWLKLGDKLIFGQGYFVRFALGDKHMSAYLKLDAYANIIDISGTIIFDTSVLTIDR